MIKTAVLLLARPCIEMLVTNVFYFKLLVKLLAFSQGKLDGKDEYQKVHYTNIYACSFYVRRSQKRKMTIKSSVSFALLEYAHAKDARKALVKSTPEG